MKYFQMIGLLVLLLGGSFGATAQYEDEVYDSPDYEDDDKKWPEQEPRSFLEGRSFVGGTFQLRFFLGSTIEASPYIGYKPADFLAFGAGLAYIRIQENFPQPVRANILGYRLFGRIKPFNDGLGFLLDGLYGHIEIERVQGRFFDVSIRGNPQPLGYQRYQATYAGIGTTTNFYEGFGFTAELLFNLTLRSQRGLYGSSPAVYRIGIYYGF